MKHGVWRRVVELRRCTAGLQKFRFIDQMSVCMQVYAFAYTGCTLFHDEYDRVNSENGGKKKRLTGHWSDGLFLILSRRYLFGVRSSFF